VLHGVDLWEEEDVQAANRLGDRRERETDGVAAVVDPEADGQADPLFGKAVAPRS
jgi:hypothetical protein